MKYVKFIKPLDGYRIDDVAEFKAEVADRVIAAGYGVEVTLESTKLADPNAKK
jgi:hypothetical protein